MRNKQYVFASCGVHFMKSLAKKNHPKTKTKTCQPFGDQNE